ncbi:hypothetical protein [Clostridium botulinum]|uniref:hypothetical protein n=1 Tax=Clostridium botulinum TaxID=1491 RepID=UPI0004DA115C|nr:hypothetical protein [Clostridium botulinum]KEI12818.1 membrane protein [Clostridium botulinum C/D str. BKT2873]
MTKRSNILLNLARLDFCKNIFSYKWIPIISSLFIVSIWTIHDVLYKSSNIKKPFNKIDVLFNILTEQHFVIYFYTPIIIYLMILAITSSFNSSSLIRIGSTTKWIISKIIIIYIISIIFVMLQFIVAFISSLQIPYNGTWSTFAQSFALLPKNIVVTYESPIIALICSLILLILGFGTLGVIILISFVCFGRRKLMLLPVILAWALTIFGLNPVIDIPNYLNYLSYGTNVSLPNSMYYSSNGFIISLLVFKFFNLILILISNFRLRNCDLNSGDKK